MGLAQCGVQGGAILPLDLATGKRNLSAVGIQILLTLGQED